MIEVGWMVELDGTLSLPNFERHNGETAKKRALTAKRVAKHGKTNASSVSGSVSSSVSSALPREEKRREEKSIKKTNRDGEVIPYLLDMPEFRGQWNRWKAHRLEKHKPLGTIEAESQLGDLLRFGPVEAAAVVDFSIRTGALNLITNGDHNRKPSTNSTGGSRHGRSKVSLDDGLLT
jgi:hypothetical protein